MGGGVEGVFGIQNLFDLNEDHPIVGTGKRALILELASHRYILRTHGLS